MDSAWESWLHSKLKFIHQWIPCNVVIHSHKFHLFFGWQFFDEKYRHHKVPLIVNRKYDWRLRKTCRWIKFGMCVLVFFCIPFKCQRKYSISRWIFGGKIFWPRKIFNINKLWVCVGRRITFFNVSMSAIKCWNYFINETGTHLNLVIRLPSKGWIKNPFLCSIKKSKAQRFPPEWKIAFDSRFPRFNATSSTREHLTPLFVAGIQNGFI